MTTWRELSFPVESQGAAELVIEDDRAKIVLDPLRWRILEILETGKSVAEISEALDVTDARVLYHAQRLAQTGVVHLEGDAASDPREWRCLPAAAVICVQEEQVVGRSSGQEDSQDRVSSQAEVSGQTGEGSLAAEDSQAGQNSQEAEAIPEAVAGQFNQAFREAAEGMYGPSFQMSVNQNRARLSEAQATEFNRRLLTLIEEYFPPGKGDRSGTKYGFYGVLTPIDLHPLGDSDSGE